jgi:hypothetical protein
MKNEKRAGRGQTGNEKLRGDDSLDSMTEVDCQQQHTNTPQKTKLSENTKRDEKTTKTCRSQ